MRIVGRRLNGDRRAIFDAIAALAYDERAACPSGRRWPLQTAARAVYQRTLVLLRRAESRAAAARLDVTYMPRVLLLATTTGYQTRAFEDAAERSGRRSGVRDRSLSRARRSLARPAIADPLLRRRRPPSRDIVEHARRDPIDGVLAVGDRPTVIAARVGAGARAAGHSVERRPPRGTSSGCANVPAARAACRRPDS